VKKLAFDWDQWNLMKNEIKHGVSKLEAESCFFDPKAKIFRDKVHSNEREDRWILYASSLEGRVLMVGFTIRKDLIRIITARPASRKEREVYGKS